MIPVILALQNSFAHMKLCHDGVVDLTQFVGALFLICVVLCGTIDSINAFVIHPGKNLVITLFVDTNFLTSAFLSI